MFVQITAHTNDCNSVAFADNSSQLLISGGDDALCKVWDRRVLREDSPLPVGILAGHGGGIAYIDPKVRRISLFFHHSVTVWDGFWMPG
jgi:WD repeat-containing protein 23